MADVLMLVATSIENDSRVRREARALADAGHRVHIIGKAVPEGFEPGDGITVSSIGASSVFRGEGKPSLAGRKLPAPMRFARWVLLPQHRRSAFGRWADGAVADARGRRFDVVHAHDFTALGAGRTLAAERGVPLIYDTHEFWTGMARQYRPTPIQDRRERRQERQWGGEAHAVITVSDGIAEALRKEYGWRHVTVVRNTFPALADPPPRPEVASGVIYAGRLAAFRDLETVAAASREVDIPVELRGPVDESWLTRFNPGRATVERALPLPEVSRRIAELGISLITLEDGWKNHQLTLPNKVFHAVSLGVPVVASDVGELGRLVREYELGELYRPGDSAALARAIRCVVADFPRYVCNVEAARPALSWEADAARLRTVYEKLASAGADGREEG